ncbi:RagB/SusD family nutrient uptake outer membrane protein [Echinicola sp. CAU 1574]|uniref:RagB/SusD family nutrient uptake outer membrane protein n=1 Tax=Echinicola arenosa TaxID=2774144 RepID=A0ABR9ATM5_9BACT|nr:RagB/SusD family nutrient uptake outer membrane protein [Echinicola arenosa]MBD8491240.1 RagB/SusD family nutrient uptake outer membrane protein [Echinicola arenosa]
MKNILKILFVGTSLAMGSCSDLLDTEPRQSLTPETAFADVEGYQSLAYSMYGRTRSFSYYGQVMMIAPEVMADNLKVIANTGRYIGQEANADRAHINLWDFSTTNNFRGLYASINDANIILDGIDGVDGDENLRNRVKGEAYFIRALNYFDLARVYGYEPGQEVNGWDQSVILRTTPTLGLSAADFRARSTNTEIYDQIIADLNQAISLLPTAEMGEEDVYRASRGAAQALLAKVYLYTSMYTEAASLASDAMTSFGLSASGNGLMEVDDYVAGFSIAPNPESLFEVEIRSQDWNSVDGLNNSVCSLVANVYPSAQFILTVSDDLLASYEPGDVRRETWTQTTREGSSAIVYRSNKWLGHKGDFLENLPIMRASELYLIRAEARYNLGNEDGARSDINALRSKRGLGATSASGTALMNQIMYENRVEFAVEGHRWFDLKRNGMTITKSGSFEEVPYSDYRILAPIPQDEIILNDLLENNPEYN